MRKSKQIRQDIEENRQRIDSIIKAAETGNRELTSAESAEVDAWIGTGDNPGRQAEMIEALGRTERIENEQKARVRETMGPQLRAKGLTSGSPARTMRDSEGRKVYALDNTQKFADFVGASTEGGIGDVCVAAVRGVRGHDCEAVRNALSTSSNPSAGYLVDGILINRVIDYARNKSVVMQAGAMSMPMTTGDVSIAAVASDPAIETKAENAAFSEAAITFQQLTLSARTIGCMITASRELIEDSMNAAQVIETTIARALATALDKMTVQGTGSAEPVGLTIDSNIDETGSVGALTWEDLAFAASKVRQANHEPNAIVLSVEPHEDLMVSTTSSNDATASKTWLLAPPALDGQNLFPSMNCPLEFAICGDFSHVLWGIRQQALVEISTSANEAFERHQVKFKITFRGDFGLTDASAFYRLSGITS